MLSYVLMYENSSEEGILRRSKSSESWILEHSKVSLFACSLQTLLRSPEYSRDVDRVPVLTAFIVWWRQINQSLQPGAESAKLQ